MLHAWIDYKFSLNTWFKLGKFYSFWSYTRVQQIQKGVWIEKVQHRHFLSEKKRLTPACVDFTHASRLLDIIVSLPWTSAKARRIPLQTSLSCVRQVVCDRDEEKETVFCADRVVVMECRCLCARMRISLDILAWFSGQSCWICVIRSSEGWYYVIIHYLQLLSTLPAQSLSIWSLFFFCIINKVTDLLFWNSRHPLLAIYFPLY